MSIHRKTGNRDSPGNRNSFSISLLTGGFIAAVSLWIYWYLQSDFQEQTRIRQTLQLTHNLNNTIIESKQHVDTLIQIEAIQKTASGEKKPDNYSAVTILTTAKNLIKASIVYVINQDGDTVACSPYGHQGDKTLTGNNYKFRPYFKQALAGYRSVYPALGVTTDKRGIYYSLPIRSRLKGTIIGVLVIKTSLTTIDLYIDDLQEPPAVALFVSPDGIIFSSGNKNWMYKVIQPLSQQRLREIRESKQFGNKKIEPLPFTINGSETVIDGKRYLVVTNPVVIPGWRVISLWPAQNNYSIIMSIIVFFTAFILTTIFSLYLFSARHRNELTQIIRKQNKRLKDANKKLKHEIAQHMHAEKELIETRDAAEVANRTKSHFLANMSHEIRTPMNAIMGITELMMESGLNKEQQEYCRTVMESSDALLAILNDILDFSKIEAGKIEINESLCNIKDITVSVCALFELKAKEKGIKINCRYLPETPEWVISDPSRIRQILINLMANAVKFTPSGHITMTVEQQDKQQDGVVVKFTVEDSGIGIDPEKTVRIFDKFSQADNSMTRRFGGTGLGLAITKELVNLMNGQISVSSEPGKGSSFVVTLKLRAGDPPPEEEKPLPDKSYLTKAEVLIVEDNPLNRKLAVTVMNKLGCNTDSAENGRIALDKIREKKYDIVFMDCQMPEMDGYEASAQIRRWENDGTLQGHITIVAMTAHAIKGDKELCLQSGMDDYISKPIKKDNIAKMIRKHIKQDR